MKERDVGKEEDEKNPAHVERFHQCPVRRSDLTEMVDLIAEEKMEQEEYCIENSTSDQQYLRHGASPFPATDKSSFIARDEERSDQSHAAS